MGVSPHDFTKSSRASCAAYHVTNIKYRVWLDHRDTTLRLDATTTDREGAESTGAAMLSNQKMVSRWRELKACVILCPMFL